MSLIDLNKNGFIDYTEWMIATTDWASVFLDNKVLINAFNYLDRDKTGVIREIELCQVF
jgi:Ca2+-binding EF-hand superfamily protein